MSKSGTIIGQITEELGELGKKVVKETVKAPVDIATGVFKKDEAPKEEKTPLDDIAAVTEQKEKQSIARTALEWLAGGRKKQPEPGVYEKIQGEKVQRIQAKEEQAKKVAFNVLPKTGSKPKPGSAFAVKQQAGSETSRNVRQD